MLNNHLEKSKAQLKNLFELSDPKNDSLVIQAIQHLEALENELKTGDSGLSQKIVHLLTQELINIYTEFLCHSSFQGLNLFFGRQTFSSTESLFKIIEALPSFFKVISYFRFKPDAFISIHENEVLIQGYLLDEQNFEKFKTEIYCEMRRLLSQHSFLTYEISQDNLILIKCTFDNPKQSYCLRFRRNSSCVVLLPSIISQFETHTPPKFPHLCLEITDDLRLVKQQGVPQNMTEGQSPDDKVIFHFPFVFRPLSLIIPTRGKIMPLNGNTSDEDTGSVFFNPVKIDLFQHFKSS